MDEAETGAYIDHRLRKAGWRLDPALAPDCAPAVHRHSGGIPRRINTLMSRLLLLGSLETLHYLTGAMVNDVSAELGSEMEAPAQSPVGAKRLAPLPMIDIARRLQQLDARSVRHDKALKRTLGLLAELVAR